ncbi:MAG: 50S ribosomal protein L22 [bacterium]
MLIGKAKSKYIRISPYKLRPIVDVIRGKRVDEALAWLDTCSMKKIVPIKKTLISAYSNAKNLNPKTAEMERMFIKEIKIDQGPVIKYFKPAAMGRAAIQRKRLSHLNVVVSAKEDKGVTSNKKIEVKNK